MRITIKTTYENVDEAWLEDWLTRVGKTPGLSIVAEELRECGHAVYVSKDPTSDCTGKTEYLLERR